MERGGARKSARNEGGNGGVWIGTQEHGLPRLQPSHGSWPGAVCEQTWLFFAMQSGVEIVYANQMEENKEPPTVVLDRVRRRADEHVLTCLCNIAPAEKIPNPSP